MGQVTINYLNIINLDDYFEWKHSLNLTVIKIFVNYNLRFLSFHNLNNIMVDLHFIIINLYLKKDFLQLD